MITLQSALQRLILAAALSAAASAAVAGPSYHVNVDTAALAGQTGFLDFSTVGMLDAPGALATFSNLTSIGGTYGVESDRVGAVLGSIPSGFSIGNALGDSYLTHAISFGGLYSFDVSFSGDYQSVASPNGTSFAVALYNADFSSSLLRARFDAQPAFAGQAAGVTVFAEGAGVAITALPTSAVPEPGTWAMLLTGLLLTGAVVRRRQQ